ncbi:hypothetical protein NL676_010808 [Syzygium grande]|nr:hypothetical protein NL676_010808 [Syzygium grande]
MRGLGMCVEYNFHGVQRTKASEKIERSPKRKELFKLPHLSIPHCRALTTWKIAATCRRRRRAEEEGEEVRLPETESPANRRRRRPASGGDGLPPPNEAMEAGDIRQSLLWTALKFQLGNKARRHAETDALDVLLEQWKRSGFTAAEVFSMLTVQRRHALENGDLTSENKKDSDGGVQINSPTAEDHPYSLNEGNEDLKSGESPSPPFTSMNEPLGSNAVVQIVEEVEAGDVLQIEQRDVEEAVGDETDGQGTELKSRSILIVKLVKEEDTEEELENTSIYIERPESAEGIIQWRE